MTAPLSNPTICAVDTDAAAVTARIDASFRAPATLLFLSAALWLVVGSVFAVLASVKMHAPAMLADCPLFTYGRVYAVFQTAFAYGFAAQAALGVAAWVLCRVGRTGLWHGGMMLAGLAFWNAGVVAAVGGILAGDMPGFAWFELPRYALPLLFIGYILMAVCAVLNFIYRRECAAFPSQWFLLAALFWFPWVFSTAALLLVWEPVRGMAQSAVHWWFVNNFLTVFLGFVGLGTILYFVPKLTNRPLHSYHLINMAFWAWVLFAPWMGMPAGSPVPAWLPAVSAVAGVLALLSVLCVAMSYFQTTAGAQQTARADASWRFIAFGALSFMAAGVLYAAAPMHIISNTTRFTYFEPALRQLFVYGFFAMTVFGAVYYILPRALGVEFCPKLRTAHFWCAVLGLLLLVVPLAAAGVMQGNAINDPNVAFDQVTRRAMMPFRMSTIGDLLLLLGHLAFAGNVIVLLMRRCRSCCFGTAHRVEVAR